MGEIEKPADTPITAAAAPAPAAKKAQKEAPQKTSKENFYIPLLMWLVAGVVLGYLVSLAITPAQVQPVPQNYTPPAPVIPAIPKASITLINDSRCVGCKYSGYYYSQIISSASQIGLEMSPANVLDSGSSEAQSLISSHGITRLPAIIVSKEAANSSQFISAWSGIGGIRDTDGSFVYQESTPYFDLQSSKMVGLVDAIEVLPGNCSQCFNVSKMLDSFSSGQIGMVFKSRTEVSANSTEGASLISKYNISRLPSLVLSSDAGAYTQVAQGWSQIGNVASDGWYVYNGDIPPYISISNGSVSGLVSVVQLVDPTCANCSDISAFASSLSQNGVVFSNTSTYLINSTEGKKYLSKYNITAAPAVLLSPDILVYSGFQQFWAKAGTFEKDGWLVLRNPGALGMTYRNLTSGNITVGTAIGTTIGTTG
jgi:hypothetical protein